MDAFHGKHYTVTAFTRDSMNTRMQTHSFTLFTDRWGAEHPGNCIISPSDQPCRVTLCQAIVLGVIKVHSWDVAQVVRRTAIVTVITAHLPLYR